MQLAFVLFAETQPIDAAALAARVKNLYALEQVTPVATEPGSTVVEIEIDGVVVMVASVGAPFPTDELRQLPPVSLRGWEDDKPDVSSRNHLIVTTHGHKDDRQAASLVTLVSSALCASESCRGIFWGTSDEFVSPRLMAEHARDAAAGETAADLWVNTYPYRANEGMGLTTSGLAEFVGREIHLLPHADHNAEELIGLGIDLADYLITNGPVLKNGHTVGFTDAQNLRVRWTEETVDGEEEPRRWIELKVEPAR